MTAITQIACMAASIIIVFHSVSMIGRMTCSTDHLVRIAYSMVSIGAFGEVVSILAGHTPGLSETLVVVGLGVMCVADRRCSSFSDRKGSLKGDLPHHPV